MPAVRRAREARERWLVRGRHSQEVAQQHLVDGARPYYPQSREERTMLINIEFQQLRCISESDDDGAQPYLWTELLQIDDDTIASGAPVFAADHPPSPVRARVVIKEQMKAGDSALIPDLLARLNARFRSDPPPLVRRDLILVAVLLDQRDTPGSAIVAGYDAFLSELPSEVANSLLALSETSGAEQDAVIKTIEDAVETQVDAAIADKIGALDKAGVWLGIESPDRRSGPGTCCSSRRTRRARSRCGSSPTLATTSSSTRSCG
jgi:hypothetical protein